MHTNMLKVTDEPRLQRLGQLVQPVTKLVYAGDFLDLLDRPLVAIVGSRKVSDYGRRVTTNLAQALAKTGVVIVSGLALGVDSIAHQAALDVGGQVIAVLPSSLNQIYPASHHQLALNIVKSGGALVTEQTGQRTSVQKWDFIARNRIIAGLSQILVITEAAAKSGSLHTANFALEQGIEVMAVPGSIYSNQSAGCNNLIKAGATPITSAQDIFDSLGLDVQVNRYTPANPTEKVIIEALRAGQLAFGQLLKQTKLDRSVLSQCLTMLELGGIVSQATNGNWSLI